MNLTSSVFFLIAVLAIAGTFFGVMYYINNPVQDTLDQNICNSAGGKWNTCSNKCQILNVNNPDIFCTAVCEELCECGTIAGLGCPEGYECILPKGIADATGYCE